jgi:cytoskeletal protein RodZ
VIVASLLCLLLLLIFIYAFLLSLLSFSRHVEGTATSNNETVDAEQNPENKENGKDQTSATTATTTTAAAAAAAVTTVVDSSVKTYEKPSSPAILLCPMVRTPFSYVLLNDYCLLFLAVTSRN